jgi:hypothetical protein
MSDNPVFAYRREIQDYLDPASIFWQPRALSRRSPKRTEDDIGGEGRIRTYGPAAGQQP